MIHLLAALKAVETGAMAADALLPILRAIMPRDITHAELAELEAAQDSLHKRIQEARASE